MRGGYTEKNRVYPHYPRGYYLNHYILKKKMGLENYYKNDPRFWFFNTKVGRVISLALIIIAIVLTVLEFLGINI